MKAKELTKALREINKSAHWVRVEGTDDRRLVFEDERAWEWFHAVLDPGKDCTYEWLHHVLEPIADYLEENEDLDDFDVHEHVDSEVDVYTGRLTSWLADNVGNVEYLTEVLQEGNTKDGFELLTAAQYRAIEELYLEVVDIVNSLLVD